MATHWSVQVEERSPCMTGNDGGTRKEGRRRKDVTKAPNYKALFRLFNNRAQHHKRVFMCDFVTPFKASQVRNDCEAPNGYMTRQVPAPATLNLFSTFT